MKGKNPIEDIKVITSVEASGHSPGDFACELSIRPRQDILGDIPGYVNGLSPHIHVMQCQRWMCPEPAQLAYDRIDEVYKDALINTPYIETFDIRTDYPQSRGVRFLWYGTHMSDGPDEFDHHVCDIAGPIFVYVSCVRLDAHSVAACSLLWSPCVHPQPLSWAAHGDIRPQFMFGLDDCVYLGDLRERAEREAPELYNESGLAALYEDSMERKAKQIRSLYGSDNK